MGRHRDVLFFTFCISEAEIDEFDVVLLDGVDEGDGSGLGLITGKSAVVATAACLGKRSPVPRKPC